MAGPARASFGNLYQAAEESGLLDALFGRPEVRETVSFGEMPAGKRVLDKLTRMKAVTERMRAARGELFPEVGPRPLAELKPTPWSRILRFMRGETTGGIY